MRWQRRTAAAVAILTCVALAQPVVAETGPQTVSEQQALTAALSGTSAVAVVLDGRGDRIIAAVREAEAARVASAPGSTLKPFFLATALRGGRARARTTVICHGDLRIAGRDLACTHPRELDVFDAEHALAYSCNTWFANLARRFAPDETVSVLRAWGFGSRTGLIGGESAGELIAPQNQAAVQLMVLGLQNVAVTPLQMAQSYARLARELDTQPVLRRGLEGSVAYGMAHNAATPGMAIAGKTGTASDPGEAWTHGWFAGIAARRAKTVVVVIYVPHGNGADAASLAHRYFALWGRLAP